MSTPKPLTIWVDEEFMVHPKVAEWIEKGHTVKSLSCDAYVNFDTAPDLILSKRAWQCTPSILDNYADVMIKSAREVKYANVAPKVVKSKSPSKSRKPRKAKSAGDSGG